MSKRSVGSRKSPVHSILLLLLICTAIATAAWSVSSTSARAANLTLNSLVTPTHAEFFAYAEIARAADTTVPTQVIPSPTPLPTEDVVKVYAEIIADTPAAEYAGPFVGGNYEQPEAPAASYSANQRILIDISEQHMYVYASDALLFSFVASTGMNNATRVGSFSVLNKIPNAYGETWDIWMPNWLGIYWAGNLQNGIHALPILSNGAQLWAGYLGTPISFGCIVIGSDESQLLYDWAEVGTPVELQW